MDHEYHENRNSPVRLRQAQQTEPSMIESKTEKHAIHHVLGELDIVVLTTQIQLHRRPTAHTLTQSHRNAPRRAINADSGAQLKALPVSPC